MIRVALTMRVIEAAGYDESRDSLSQDWTRRLAEWGMTPYPIPNVGESAPALLAGVSPDLLVLTGGDDLGATPVRDATETALLAHAVESGLPVLGVCRGMQLINVHFGGRLAAVAGHVGTPHPVAFAATWRGLYGDETAVNSFHGQAIPKDGVGAGLAATATDADGRVEGFCLPDRPLAGIMWHPERTGAPAGDRLLLTGLAAGRLPWR